MLDRIVLSQDRKSAVVHFDTHSVTLYHSEARILDMVCIILKPFGSQVETWDQLVASQEDTQEIDISQLETKKVA